MAKPNSYIDRIQKRHDADIALCRKHARTYMLDMVTVALGRMGFRESRFKQFDKVLAKVSEDYAKLILDDARDDKDLWYSKGTLDAELKAYVGSLFVPYDERYH